MIPVGFDIWMRRDKPSRPYKARLEYLESTGTQYIDTGIPPSSDMSIETNFRCTKLVESGMAHWAPVMGADTGWDYRGFGVHIRVQTVKYAPTSAPNLHDYPFVVGVDYNFVLDNGVCKVNEEVLFTDSRNFEINYPIYIFANNRPNELQTCNARFRYFKIAKGGTLVLDLIPVLDNNNVACMYDEVSGEFFYNQGTGSFTAGPVIGGV